MSLYIPPAENITDAWRLAMAMVDSAAGGTATNVMLTVTDPLAPDSPLAREAVNAALRAGGQYSVETVANTLFPSSFYATPGFNWMPGLAAGKVKTLDDAAESMYEMYQEALPMLTRLHANQRGTYFSRMISWPGKTGNGVNQLKDRIEFLRLERTNGRETSNSSDLTIAGDGDFARPVAAASGIQECSPIDRRPQGFPCLVHIDLSAHRGALAITAIYRHWHLITRAYGNLVGLARLQSFLAQQTGFAVGELVVVAGYANAERGEYGGSRGVQALLDATAPSGRSQP